VELVLLLPLLPPMSPFTVQNPLYLSTMHIIQESI
jgi:hypothetical protein